MIYLKNLFVHKMITLVASNFKKNERIHEAQDMAAIQKVQDTGNMALAYEMRQQQGLYAADKFANIHAELIQKLDAGMEDLRTARTGMVKSGEFVAAASIKIATRRGAKSVKGSNVKADNKAAAKVAAVRAEKLKADAKLKGTEELKKESGCGSGN